MCSFNQNISQNELLSHPNYTLNYHLLGVADLVQQYINEKDIPLLENPTSKLYTEYIAKYHDIGKSTGFFQEYIRDTDNYSLGNKLKNHSLLSALMLYKEIKNSIDIEQGENYFFSLLAYLSVLQHHSNLNDWYDEFSQYNEELKGVLDTQIKSIKRESFSVLLTDISNRGDKSVDSCISEYRELISLIDKFYRDSRKFIRKFKRESKSLRPYFTQILLFSLLIDADKSQVGILQKNKLPTRKQIDCKIIDEYKIKQNYSVSRLNSLREQAYQDVSNIDIDLDKHNYSLQLPTGMGKTLTVLKFALNLKEKIKVEKEVDVRIIYSLPYLSVIDQTAKIIKDILDENNIKSDSSMFLTHHHLSEIKYNDDNEYTSNAAKLLIEGWNSELILTTFVQLFNSFISNKNSHLRRFHRLANSIIIIDEIQAIPSHYWPLVREMILNLAKYLDCYFIFSTATTPAIFSQEELVNLVQSKDYYLQMDRIKLYSHLHKPAQTIEEFVRNLNIDNDKTYLFIMNTVEASRKLYGLLREFIDKKELTYLSTVVIPKERLDRINDIKEGKYRVVVSTQLVEAGVDVDFDRVYRDFAPMDSINQSAGRCNRNGLSNGEVHIICLKDENKRYASYVYDYVKLNVTESLLKDKDIVVEKDFFDLINLYYESLNEKINSVESTQLLKAAYTLYFEGDNEEERIPISQFNLIKNGYEKMDVFIEVDNKAESIFSQYSEILNSSEKWDVNERFNNIKMDFYQYVISIPIKIDNKPPIVNGIGYVSLDNIKQYYDGKLGYKSIGDPLIW